MSSVETQTTDNSTNGTQDPYKMVDPNSTTTVAGGCDAPDGALESVAVASNDSNQS